MAHVLLLHSALGLRPGVHTFADRLRELGHEVVVPDYYEGHVFEQEVPGIAHRDAHPEYFEAVRELAAQMPPETALIGMSLGSFFAQRLAARRPRARAAILMHSVAAPRHDWSGVPVQVHRHEDDPWIAPGDVVVLGAAVEASGAPFEDHVTPGRGHLFADPDLPGYDEAATGATVERIDGFLR
ncbi:dienelactone hydrolase family protein [Janibacter sp. G349]|uniref:dienelactone hydrolase family protein n=1 Tax=unclassified Janibacter TaxID=2649294 RepID=UPI003B77FCD3